MKSVILVVVAIATLTAGKPTPDPQANVVQGVFIPADTFRRLQEQANANRQNQPEVRNPEPVQTAPIIVNQPASQPLLTNQQTVPAQQTVPNQAPANQPNTNQPIYLLQEQPSQPIVLQAQKQPTNVVVTSNPSGQQPTYTNSNFYAVVPLTNSNQNPSNGNTYLIPLSTGSSNPIILKAASA